MTCKLKVFNRPQKRTIEKGGGVFLLSVIERLSVRLQQRRYMTTPRPRAKLCIICQKPIRIDTGQPINKPIECGNEECEDKFNAHQSCVTEELQGVIELDLNCAGCGRTSKLKSNSESTFDFRRRAWLRFAAIAVFLLFGPFYIILWAKWFKGSTDYVKFSNSSVFEKIAKSLLVDCFVYGCLVFLFWIKTKLSFLYNLPASWAMKKAPVKRFGAPLNVVPNITTTVVEKNQ